MNVEITRFVTGPIETNTYIVSNEQKACLIVDPSSDCMEVLNHIRALSMTLEAIILTHAHFDHVLGVPEILEEYPATPVWVHRGDRALIAKSESNGAFLIGQDFTYNGPLQDLTESTKRIGSFDCTVFHVPGHTPGGCALVFGAHCLSGDSLFAGSVGRTDFEYGDSELLLKNIKEKLLVLPEATVVYPGHGGRTTIGREKRLNPFLQE